MAVATTNGETPATRGSDAVDYGAFSHVIADGELLVYAADEDAADEEDAWIRSDRFVALEERQ